MPRIGLGIGHGLYIPSSGGVTPNLLLDDYPNAAAAYSVRKLRTAYAGSAIRVRRSSDNAEQDIGFSGGNLDTTALTSFCSGTNGFVTTWYDQSGNGNNAMQTTAANQPQIISSGSIITRNSKPYIEATSTRYFQTLSDLNAGIGTDYSLWLTYEKDNPSTQAVILKDGSNFHWLDYGSNQYITNSNVITISPLSINTLYLINTITDYYVGATMYSNGTSIGTRGPLSSEAISNTFPSNGYRTAKITFAEFVYYPSNQSANRTGIENNINDYYGIY